MIKQNGMSELEQSLLKGYIENYLNTIRPVFLLLPVVSDGFFKMTRAMIQKKGFDLEMPEDLGNKLMEFMNEDISVLFHIWRIIILNYWVMKSYFINYLWKH